MNWYIAICSLITGFVLGLVVSKWADVKALKDEFSQFITLTIKANNVVNRNFGRLFDINRELLKVHLSPDNYDKAIKKIKELETPDA